MDTSLPRKIITVDGLAGSGKSSLSRLLAEKVHYVHFNTGVLYRAVAALALRGQVSSEDVPALLQLIAKHCISFESGEGCDAQLRVDGASLQSELFTPEMSQMTSLLSRHPQIRGALLGLQRMALPGRNLVAEGRDVGTVVFPGADLKFFITAAQGVRVERRIRQLYGQDIPPSRLKSLKREIEIEVVERDSRDQGRAASPTIPAQDAVIIDNSAQTLTAIVDCMYDFVLKRGLIDPLRL